MSRNISENKYRPSKGTVTIEHIAHECVDKANTSLILKEWSDFEKQGKLKPALYVMIVSNFRSRMFREALEQSLKEGVLIKPSPVELFTWFNRVIQSDPRIAKWTTESKGTEVLSEDDWVPENAKDFLQPIAIVNSQQTLSVSSKARN